MCIEAQNASNLLTRLTFFFTVTPTTDVYTLSLHDALPISGAIVPPGVAARLLMAKSIRVDQPPAAELGDRRSLRRSEEHTSELQSPYDLVCRLLLEKKNKNKI